ncbi:phage tail protein I [Pseudomonas inefficax]|uniref:phage tail protein I n=1 Tax=Pseudomonas inefficax TaxID=2078786 RepID=UPI004046AF49
MSLLPSNSTRLERILEAARDFGLDPEAIRGLADSARCPPDFLPWLAWAMKVEGWEAAETTPQQRALIRDAIPIHKTKGTVGAIRRVLRAVNVNAEVKEWHQIPGAVPYTFQITAWANENREGEGSIISPQLGKRLQALINAAKNERSHYDFRLGARFDGGFVLGNTTLSRTVQRRNVQAQALPLDQARQDLQFASAANALCVYRRKAEAQGVPIYCDAGFTFANATQIRRVLRCSMETVQ